jgi:hypothetical protein
VKFLCKMQKLFPKTPKIQKHNEHLSMWGVRLVCCEFREVFTSSCLLGVVSWETFGWFLLFEILKGKFWF